MFDSSLCHPIDIPFTWLVPPSTAWLNYLLSGLRGWRLVSTGVLNAAHVTSPFIFCAVYTYMNESSLSWIFRLSFDDFLKRLAVLVRFDRRFGQVYESDYFWIQLWCFWGACYLCGLLFFWITEQVGISSSFQFHPSSFNEFLIFFMPCTSMFGLTQSNFTSYRCKQTYYNPATNNWQQVLTFAIAVTSNEWTLWEVHICFLFVIPWNLNKNLADISDISLHYIFFQELLESFSIPNVYLNLKWNSVNRNKWFTLNRSGSSIL